MRQPSHRALCNALKNVETFREFIHRVQQQPAGQREIIFARLQEIEMARDEPRRSIVHKLFTLRWAVCKSIAWSRLEALL